MGAKQELLEISRAAVTSARRRSNTLAITWLYGAQDEFHYAWLRDNCYCSFCRHPATHERIQDPLSWPLDLCPRDIVVTKDGDLHLGWEDGHESLFGGAWLDAHRYSEPAQARRHPATETWDATFSDRLPSFDHDQVMADDRSLLAWLQALDRYGLALLRSCPGEHLQVLRVADRVGYARPTNFGVHFDVDSKPNPNNNAYTALALPAHTDLPNWANPPGFQLLHCLAHEAVGGDSFFVDGARATELLQAEAPDAFKLLSTTPLDFRFHDDTSDVRFRAPAIAMKEGAFGLIRHNHGILDVIDVAFDQVEALYRAHRTLTSLLKRPELVVRCRLRPGDIVTFDNHRVLHGRTEFDPNSGNRHFQGCYVEHDELLSRMRVLQRYVRP